MFMILGKHSAVFGGVVKAIAASLIFCTAVNMFSFAEDCRGLRRKVLRLHIVANSDMLCDQEVKLKVRDRILELSADIFSGCTGIDEAVSTAEGQLGKFEQAAEEVLRENGFDYSAEISLCRDFFPTRRYETATLPAGIYEALRIELGSAQGHNWWCVMFPMMCIPSSCQTGMDGFFSEGEMRVTELDGFDVRFKCVELYEKIKAHGEQ